MHNSLTRPRRRQPRQDRGPRLRPRLVGELLIVAFLIRIYDLIKQLGDRRRSVGLANAGRVRGLERTLRLDWERSLNSWTNHHHALALVCAYWYQFAHESITLLVLAWLWAARPWQYRRARNALVLINVVGLAVFTLFPVAPPRLLPGGAYVDSVAAAGFGTSHGGPVATDQYAAMPSLHLAWATWTVAMLLLNTRPRALRALLLAYLPWMAFVVVGTGNHYVLDAVAGVVVAAASLAVTRAMSPAAAVEPAEPPGAWAGQGRRGWRGRPPASTGPDLRARPGRRRGLAAIDLDAQDDVHDFVGANEGLAFFGATAPGVREGDLLERSSNPRSGTWVVTDVTPAARDDVRGRTVRYVRKA